MKIQVKASALIIHPGQHSQTPPVTVYGTGSTYRVAVMRAAEKIANMVPIRAGSGSIVTITLERQ